MAYMIKQHPGPSSRPGDGAAGRRPQPLSLRSGVGGYTTLGGPKMVWSIGCRYIVLGIWMFPKRSAILGVPTIEDHGMFGFILGSPIYGNTL